MKRLVKRGGTYYYLAAAVVRYERRNSNYPENRNRNHGARLMLGV